MALFGFRKKNEEKSMDSGCSCGCSQTGPEYKESEERNNESQNNGGVKIAVLGTGCKNCHDLLENTKEAVKGMGLSVEVDYVTDMQKIMEYGVMSMPALAIGGEVVSAGKVLKPTAVTDLLKKHLSQQ